MDRAIFNLTKYSIFLYLHCTDTQINIHYSSALLPLSVVAGVRITWPTSMTTDLTILTHRKTHTRSLTHTHTVLLWSMWSRSRGGASRTSVENLKLHIPRFPPTLAFHKPLPVKVKRLSARRCFLIGSHGWGQCVKKTLATELGGFSPGVLSVLVSNTPCTVGTVWLVQP